MTRVTFRRRGKMLTLRCDGHAEYGETGKDIVCSGISAICQTLALWCRNADGVELLAHIQEPGKFRLTAACRDEEPWKAAAMGLLGIEKRYPDNLTVKIPENFF